jgi:hypothetical protein
MGPGGTGKQEALPVEGPCQNDMQGRHARMMGPNDTPHA